MFCLKNKVKSSGESQKINVKIDANAMIGVKALCAALSVVNGRSSCNVYIFKASL